ncbi:MAG TPA: recombinase family protein [Gemmatimonadales bacterium]|nr:recombinase family protein [Gemmatimonadales bacterium]
MTSAAIYGRQSHGKKKSITDQLELGAEAVEVNGWELAGTYSDKVGASRYSGKVRGGWDEIRAAVDAGAFDVLVLWEPSRGDRKPGEWLAFLESCRAAGVQIHILTDDRTYDTRKARDWKTLASAGVDSAYEVDVLADRARRGIAKAAKAGAPHGGHAPYGYRVVYDETTGERGYEVDPETGPVVTWLIEQCSKSRPVRAIIRDLEEQGIPGPAGGKWYRGRIRVIALNVAYLGIRSHNGERHAGTWPPLTDPETFATAGRVLNEPKRMEAGKHARPGLYKNLLTYIAKCSVCKEGVRAYKEVYGCTGGHVWVKRERVDGLITELAILRLSSPDLYAALAQESDAADEVLRAASAEVATLTEELEDWRRSAWDGRGTTPATLAAVEAGLTARIAAAQERIDAATVPADLRGWVGPEADVRARWAEATLQARRTVLRALRMGIEILPAGGKTLPIQDRVQVTWQNGN